jgi:hypothetical protein
MRALVIAIGCFTIASACGAQPSQERPSAALLPRATVSASKERMGCDARTPAEATELWVATVERGRWSDLVECFPPGDRERARNELLAAPENKLADEMARRQRAAAKVRAALKDRPSFVSVPPALAEPAQLEWYYCGERPAGAVWQSPCAVSVVEANGRFYVRRVTDDAP